jgi:hypothetical protein
MEVMMPEIITDAALWELRTLTQKALALRLGVDRHVVRDALIPRGWTFGRDRGGVATAPCQDCGRPFDVQPDTVERLCADCEAGDVEVPPLTDDLLADPAALLERERLRIRAARRKVGEREWTDRYQRTGGPEMRGMRRYG